MIRIFRVLFVLLSIAAPARAQEDPHQYVPESDPAAAAKLEQWQDARFGLLMHWGTYSQWGIVESWSLCSEDESWTQRSMDNYDEYKKSYTSLKKTFNPVKFDPQRWAAAARDAGMKYVVFTTKHHDGFCMFDTRQTDYKITSTECPFHSHPKADITRAVFDAFRKAGFMVGAYYSKPDWNCESYWWPYFATPDRHVNYDPAKYPGRWKKFKEFTFNQIEELTTGYGPMDILWLDGAWVRPIDNMPEAFRSWALKKNYNQDIGMDSIASMARGHQPGLIIVDRWVGGRWENYLTPEQKIPESALNVPWESCITMAGSWSYVPNDIYKPVPTLIRMLVEIVSKGGNFLLNIGPSPEGEWAPDAYDRLKGIGEWMKVNGEAITGSRPLSPFREGKVRLTHGKDGTVYAICLADEGETGPPPAIGMDSFSPGQGAKIRMLGTSKNLPWKPAGKGFRITIPESLRKNPPCRYAWTFKISPTPKNPRNMNSGDEKP